jgi:dienelactone hydrolase
MEQVHFFNGELRLQGNLYKPAASAPCPVVVAVHPASQGNADDPYYNHLKLELPRHGIAAFVYDRRGSRASQGDFETASFEDLAGDVLAAVRYLQSRPDIDSHRVGLHATSQGGWIAPIAAALEPRIAFIVCVSASGVSPADQMDYGAAFHLEQAGFDQQAVQSALRLRREVNEYFRRHRSRDEVVSSLSRSAHEPWFEKAYLSSPRDLPVDVTLSKWSYEMDYEPLSIWKQVHAPTLFLFAGIDEWVPVDESMVNYSAVTHHIHSVMLRQIPNVDHLMRNLVGVHRGEIAQSYLDVLLPWLQSVLVMAR